jgi:Ribonuclease HI
MFNYIQIFWESFNQFQIALKNLLMRGNIFKKIVILSGSKAAIQAMSWPNSCKTIECHKIISSLHNDAKVISLHWIPLHSTISRNKTADMIAKNRSHHSKISPVNFTSIKLHI